MMEAKHYSEKPFLTRSTRHHIPEDGILHIQRCENLKSHDINELGSVAVM
jgi:hypothetical protein